MLEFQGLRHQKLTWSSPSLETKLNPCLTILSGSNFPFSGLNFLFLAQAFFYLAQTFFYLVYGQQAILPIEHELKSLKVDFIENRILKLEFIK